MDGLYKIIAIGLISALIIICLKSANSELAAPVSIASGLLILLMTVSYVKEFVSFFKDMANVAGMDDGIYKIVLKVLAISYLSEFASGAVEDLGQKNLSEKIQFASKTIMIVLAMPLLKNLIEKVVALL
ncbi:MAG: SpoIIIAC/SpoIIIAD family protein [Clostridia bacterium]|nr:SpoIIIAC/SpoIIIAD family protein [Clostridia bacterium]